MNFTKAFLSMVHSEDEALARASLETAFEKYRDFVLTFRLKREDEEVASATAEWKSVFQQS